MILTTLAVTIETLRSGGKFEQLMNILLLKLTGSCHLVHAPARPRRRHDASRSHALSWKTSVWQCQHRQFVASSKSGFFKFIPPCRCQGKKAKFFNLKMTMFLKWNLIFVYVPLGHHGYLDASIGLSVGDAPTPRQSHSRFSKAFRTCQFNGTRRQFVSKVVCSTEFHHQRRTNSRKSNLDARQRWSVYLFPLKIQFGQSKFILFSTIF